MDRPIPKPGERYTHFKGKLYQILCVAKHSETGEQMVVYQALYDSYACYVRPLALFMEEVDRVKYPKAEQVYRFERADAQETETQYEKAAEAKDTAEEQQESYIEQESELGQANPALLCFLDADTLEQKYHILKSLENSITDRLIDDFAAALDLVIPEGSLDNRYLQLLSSVRTMQRFENTRFR